MEGVTPERARQAIAGTFPGDLGIEFTHLEPDEVRCSMPVDRRHLHAGGYVHGGAWVAFADTGAAFGTMANLPAGTDFTTVELKMNVFGAARDGDQLHGVGRPVHIGKRTQVWEVRVARGERDAALFICTQMVLAR